MIGKAGVSKTWYGKSAVKRIQIANKKGDCGFSDPLEPENNNVFSEPVYQAEEI